VGGASATLTEHWNGAAWSVVSSPVPNGSASSALNAVSAASSTNVWAVGYSQDASFVRKTLVERWNGKRWQIVASPNPSPYENRLTGVAALSPTDVWAVGASGQEDQVLVEHWNGTTWSVVSTPSAGSGDNILYGVTAVAANDVWGVGAQAEGTRTLTEHWNGSAWSIVASPNPDAGTANDDLIAVSAITGTDVWAVGFSSNYKTLTFQWNGSRWKVVTSPNPSPVRNELFGVAAVSGGTVWAVGGQAPANAGQDQTLILQTTRG